MVDKIIFLDRDGVINKDIEGGYITSWEEFQFLPNTLTALGKLSTAGFEVIIISNQAGVSKGLYSQESLALLTRNMIDEIKKSGARINSVHYCSHRPDEDCACRKPKLGLFKQALLGRQVDLGQVFMVGDSEKDIAAGKKLGCKTILVLSGKARKREDVANFKVRPDFIAEDLLDAVDAIIIKKDE